MREFVQDKGTINGMPVIVQGVFLDSELESLRVLDGDGVPFSWGLSEQNIADYEKVIRYIYKQRGIRA